MVVGRTSSRSFQVGGSSRSFLVLVVYIGVEVEEFFSLDNALLGALAHFSYCCLYTHLVNLSFLSVLDFSSRSLVGHSCVLDRLLVVFSSSLIKTQTYQDKY